MMRCQRCQNPNAHRNYPISDFTVPVCDRCFRILCPGTPVRQLAGQLELPNAQNLSGHMPPAQNRADFDMVPS